MPKKRCNKCNKKIKSSLPVQCKCEHFFCNLHRLPFDHDCNFDYINNYKQKLEKTNIKIIPEKIPNKLES